MWVDNLLDLLSIVEGERMLLGESGWTRNLRTGAVLWSSGLPPVPFVRRGLVSGLPEAADGNLSLHLPLSFRGVSPCATSLFSCHRDRKSPLRSTPRRLSP